MKLGWMKKRKEKKLKHYDDFEYLPVESEFNHKENFSLTVSPYLLKN